ncbi:MAG: alpha-glucosidase [Mogibacterium sp.]|nr:alpha-glucosidase [Mogibacterium sp.]
MIRKWWHDKTAYQIYPKSFCDSNGDGVGDIQGIISKLDYLKSLGIDIIWISPCYTSPWADQGYDISDYYNVDPRFGTIDDMDELIREARRRGMYILMDLVVNHCSDEHEWFRRACEDPDGKYGKYFYIENRDSSGGVPCNWRSAFGGSVWEPLPGHPDKCYLHIFHKKQPDLNWENPEVREEVYNIIKWWMERGVAGFRIDAIIDIKKALPFRDYAAGREDGLCDISAMLENAEGIGEFLGEMRDMAFAPYKALTIGEVFNEKYDELGDFIGENGYFSSMFDFSHVVEGQSRLGCYAHRKISIDDYKRCVLAAQKRIGDTGFFSNVIENHDRPRAASYYLPESGRTEEGKKCLALAYFMLRGLPFIYQGQEIGMENTVFNSPDDFDDIGTIDEYHVAIDAGLSEEEAMKAVSLYSRDNARTPMQWTTGHNAGFSEADPWLPVNPDYKLINVSEQAERRDSVYSFYRQIIALRKNPDYSETLVWGDLEPVYEEREGLLAYYRRADRTLLILANLKPESENIEIDCKYRTLLDNMNSAGRQADIAQEHTQRHIQLQAWQGMVLELMPE